MEWKQAPRVTPGEVQRIAVRHAGAVRRITNTACAEHGAGREYRTDALGTGMRALVEAIQTSSQAAGPRFTLYAETRIRLAVQGHLDRATRALAA